MSAVADMTDQRGDGSAEKTAGPDDVVQLKVPRHLRDRIAEVKRLLAVRDGRTWNMQDAAAAACGKAVEDYLMALRASVTRAPKRR